MTTTIRVHPPSARVVADERAIVLPFRLHADAVEELLEALPPVVEPPRVQVEVSVPCPHAARTGTPRTSPDPGATPA